MKLGGCDDGRATVESENDERMNSFMTKDGDAILQTFLEFSLFVKVEQKTDVVPSAYGVFS